MNWFGRATKIADDEAVASEGPVTAASTAIMRKAGTVRAVDGLAAC
jgi:hypothetical protein